MTILLDANVLIALVVADHVHHDAAESWLDRDDFVFATCPATEGSLVRLLLREGPSGGVAARRRAKPPVRWSSVSARSAGSGTP